MTPQDMSEAPRHTDRSSIEPGLCSIFSTNLQEIESQKRNSRQKNKIRPRRIDLPPEAHYDAVLDPILHSAGPSALWSKDCFSESLPTPVDYPEGTFEAFWGRSEGSVISSTLSADSNKERIPHIKRHTKLERPLVGRPRDTRERCMSVSLVVGSDGVAQVTREEVEVEFLKSQKEVGLDSDSLMQRIASSTRSEVSLSRPMNNLSLINSTRGEVLVRSGSQQTNRSISFPLTPLPTKSQVHVSPVHLRKDSESMLHSSSMLGTPDSDNLLSDDEKQVDLAGSDDVVDDAQMAVKLLYDRKLGNGAQSFIANSMPLSPLAVPRAKSSLSCSACQIVFRSRDALSLHSSRCSVKQTPFVSADFLESSDVFQMTEDMLFMSEFTAANAGDSFHDPLALPIGSLLRQPHRSTERMDTIVDEQDDTSPHMTPRKKSRYDSMATLPTTPVRSKKFSVLTTSKRKP